MSDDHIPDDEPTWRGWRSDGFRPKLVGGRDVDSEEVKLPSLLSLPEFLATFKMPDYIIDGIIQRGRLYALTSPTGHGKTAVAQFMGIHIASGRNIGYIEVTGGPVIFLAGENPDDLCVRMYAAMQFHSLNAMQVDMHFMAGNFPLTQEAAELLKGKINASGINPVMIIFDTAAAFFPGEDDNSNIPMGDYARNLRVLTTCNGYPAVLVPAHPVKDPSRDNLLPRGGGGFLNELDGNLTLWGSPVGEAAVLSFQKLRGAEFQPVNFELKPVKIHSLLDGKGRPLLSIVACLQTADQAESVERQSYSNGDIVLKLMKQYPGISIRSIAEHAGWMNDQEKPLVSKVQRLLADLKEDKLVYKFRKKWALTPLGKKALDPGAEDDE